MNELGNPLMGLMKVTWGSWGHMTQLACWCTIYSLSTESKFILCIFFPYVAYVASDFPLIEESEAFILGIW